MTPQELKSSILQLAIQGKLVEQHSREGSARELYGQIQREKRRLVKAGKIKKEPPLPPVFEAKIPFEIPKDWMWIRIGEITALVTKGTTPRSGNIRYQDSGIGFLRAENVAGLDKLDKTNLKFVSEETHSGYLKRSMIQEHDILITIADTLGRTAIVRKEDLPLNANQAVSILRLVSPQSMDLFYMACALNAAEIQRYLFGRKKTTAIPNFTLETIKNCIIPLPPLAEQKRIAAKIKELLPCIGRYEQAWTRLEDFNGRFPGDMKKSLLQYAIQGRLVEQRPQEGGTVELYARIQREKQRLIKEGKIKREKRLPPVAEAEAPFQIPKSWMWVRLRNIVYNRGQIIPSEPFAYIDIGSIDNQHQALSAGETILEPGAAPSRARKLVGWGDILYATVRPYLHNMCIVDRVFTHMPIASTGFAVLSCHQGINRRYLFYYLMSPSFDRYVNASENAKGVAYPAINDDKLYRAPIALPPLAEQERIVARLEKLLPLCEKLR